MGRVSSNLFVRHYLFGRDDAKILGTDRHEIEYPGEGADYWPNAGGGININRHHEGQARRTGPVIIPSPRMDEWSSF